MHTRPLVPVGHTRRVRFQQPTGTVFLCGAVVGYIFACFVVGALP